MNTTKYGRIFSTIFVSGKNTFLNTSALSCGFSFPIFFISFVGRIVPIVVRVGTALSRFIIKNPKIIGSTMSVQAISAAIQSHEATEKEKIDIVNDIGKENPQLRQDLFKDIFLPNTNLISNIIPYIVLILIIYIIIKK